MVDRVIVEMDHSILVDENDPMLTVLREYPQFFGKLYILPFATSAESVAKYLYECFNVALPLATLLRVELKETTSSTVIYE